MSKLRYCGIVRCPNNQGIKDPDCKLFKPNNPDTINKWKTALENLGLECSSYRPMICNLHFVPDDFIIGKKILRPGAIPSITCTPAMNEIMDFSNVGPSSSPIQHDIKLEYPLEMVELKMMPNEVDAASSIQDCNQMWKSMNGQANHFKSGNEFADHCTECTKNLTKMQFLEKNYENLRKKYKKLLKDVAELRRAQNQSVATFDDDHDAMAIENGVDDYYEEWCEVCWKRLTSDDVRQHICMDNIKGIRCEYCSLLLKSTVELKDHLLEANHPNPKMYKCETCTLEYPSALLLLFHQMSELDHAKSTKNAQTIKCYVCEAEFDSKPQMQLHIRDHLVVQKCEFCNQKCTFHDLGEHVCDGHETMHCEYCSKPFNATIKLAEHLNSQHTDDVVLYKCQKCTKFLKMNILKEIHEKHHPNEVHTFWCEECPKGFATEMKLYKHMEIHENNGCAFVCEKCGRAFKTENHLAKHSAVHGERVFQCPDCPAAFRRKNGLNAHRSMHQNIKYKCSQCELTYTTKNALQSHIRVAHTKTPKVIDRKFACSLCPLKFHKSSKLISHKRTHSGEKPYACTYCDQKYAYRGDLNKHLKIHVGNNIYTCEECGMGFRLPTEFRRHTFEHYKKREKIPTKIE